MTKDIAELLDRVQADGIAVMQHAASGNVNTDPLEQDIIAVERQMLKELTAVTVPLNPAR